MKKTSFNLDWTVKKGVVGPFEELLGGSKPGTPVTLPHDAMICEERDPAAVSGAQLGFYPAHSYTYVKKFTAPESWAAGKSILEFEGVQRRAMVYLNGEFVAGHSNSYTGFQADLTPFLRYGRENTLKVLAVNEERSSRWYPGSGIYRDVWLWQGDRTHFLPDKQRVTTEYLEEDYACMLLEGTVSCGTSQAKKLRITADIYAPDGALAENTFCWLCVQPGEQAVWHTRLTVEAPQLWSVESPSLYRLELKLWDGEKLLDTHEETFGIRTLRLDARKGLRINGREVKLRGACIHHDNGIIGAATYYDAEVYRLKKMKEAGFNALRSAHHPMSKAMLRACDELGVLVMDEFADMWREPKNACDWSLDFEATWHDTLERIVDKDYNHPCVVLYSTGNEIPELSQLSGAVQGRKVAEELRRLDPTRYTTFGLNGFLACRDHIGQFAPWRQEESPAGQAEGSEGLNSVMGSAKFSSMDSFSVGDMLTACVEAAASGVDAAGYNYLTARHEFEKTLAPHRVVVGSETFPGEIGRLWPIVQRNAHVVGDFTWTGYDYVGEAGIGVPHYQDTKGAQGVYPDRLAYCGDIDLNGTRRPVSYLRQIAFGLRKDPFIAVGRVDKQGLSYDDNNWKYADSLDSWTFPGYEGKETVIRVLANCEEAELILNGESLGRAPVGQLEEYTAFFKIPYQPGELKAVAWKAGSVVGQTVLTTASAPRALRLEADRKTLAADAQSLAFVTVALVDDQGRENRWESADVTVSLEGPGEVLGYGSACPSCEGSYQDLTWKTWDGKVMAVIRSTLNPGEIRLRFRAEGLEDGVLTLISE